MTRRFLFVVVLILTAALRVQAQRTQGAPGAPTAQPGGGRVAHLAEPVKINILTSYYAQDGDRAAVTGGRGTEQLTDFTPTFILNVPLDSVARVTANLGLDSYSSASTDRIDDILSSPSGHDVRLHADLGYLRRIGRTTWGAGGGVSSEYDYLSFNVIGSWARDLAGGSAQLTASAQAYFDQAAIATRFVPVELRFQRPPELPASGRRRSYNFTFGYAQLLSRRVQAALAGEAVYQTGWLSTIFHRVYFRDSPDLTDPDTGPYFPNPLAPVFGSLPRIERLPETRFKYPVSARINWFATDWLILRGFYRHYADSWAVRGNTLELEAPLKMGPFFTLYPLYRYHHQVGARYFAPFGAHSVADAFYTSDYDLAPFTAHKFGGGVRWSPLSGLARVRVSNTHQVQLKGLDARFAHYRRSTGLTADIFSLDLSFEAY